MKKYVIKALVVAIAGLAVSAANAATKPTRVVNFTMGASSTFTAKPPSWRDPAFGSQGWTHNSDWGKFTATAGKAVTITLTSVAGFHPGITVWYRGADDTASDDYVPDHFYTQNGNFVEFGAKDETTSKAIGNISMQNVAYNYDQDGHTLKPWSTSKGLTDSVNGKVVLKFTASKAGTYMFVVGGINPASTLKAANRYNVTVQVK
jgi:hypothetical protein